MPSDSPSDLRELLVTAAREILDEPDTPLDLRKVAERAGKSRTAPYLVFGPSQEGGGIEALKLAVATSGFRELIIALKNAFRSTPDAELGLKQLAQAYLRFAVEHPRLFRLMFGSEVSRSVRRGLRGAGAKSHPEIERFIEARAEAEALITEAVRAAQSLGGVAPGSSRSLALGAWAMFHGMATLLLDGQLDWAGIPSTPPDAADLVMPFLLQDSAVMVAESAQALVEAHLARGLESPSPELSSGDLRERSPDYRTTRRNVTRTVLQQSPALRRARRMRGVFEGARILWVDDQPELSDAEERFLRHLGARIERALDTDEAVELLEGKSFHVIISDIRRLGSETNGVEDLPRVRRVAGTTPVIFYTGRFDPEMGRPEGSWGITNSPEELLHLILDVLERRRL